MFLLSWRWILQHYGEAKYSPHFLKTAATLYTIVIICTNVSAKYFLPQPLLKQLLHIKKNYDVRKRFIFSRIYIYTFVSWAREIDAEESSICSQKIKHTFKFHTENIWKWSFTPYCHLMFKYWVFLLEVFERMLSCFKLKCSSPHLSFTHLTYSK